LNRRAFLKQVVAATTLVGISLVTRPEVRAAAGFLPSQASASIQALGRHFQGTTNGRLLESLDGGQTWKKIADFGDHCSVLAIQERHNTLYLQVGIQQFSFFLKSSDGRLWRTIDAIPAA